MIFVTTGSMFPFDRLVRAMDAWSAQRPRVDVLAQIGAGSYKPSHMRWVRTLAPRAFVDAIGGADLVVAHAGMGTVITASECGKPIVILPRRRELGEHTSNHQLDTANWLSGKLGIFVAASDGGSLDAAIRDGLQHRPHVGGVFAPEAAQELIRRLRQELMG